MIPPAEFTGEVAGEVPVAIIKGPALLAVGLVIALKVAKGIHQYLKSKNLRLIGKGKVTGSPTAAHIPCPTSQMVP